MTISPRQNQAALWVAFGAFIVLGMPSGLLGVVWPDMRDTFQLSQDALGALLLAGTIGHIVAGMSNGRLFAWLGLGTLLLFSALLELVAYAGYATTPSWWLLVGLGLLTGAGSGMLDAAVNTYVAAKHSARVMNWLHACFGIGATLAPFVMSAVYAGGFGWRTGYVVIALCKLGTLIALWLTRQQWQFSPPTPSASPADTPTRSIWRWPLVWLSLALFFFYGGLEVTPPNWGFTFFTESRGLSADVVLVWSGLYWGVFTCGRIALGALVGRLGATRLLRLSLLAAVVGTVLIWQPWLGPLSLIGFVLIGIALAPVFPTVIAQTPQLYGLAHSARIIGLQVGLAGVGIALVPALAGLLIERLGLEILGPFLVVTAIVVFVLHESILSAQSRHKT